MPHLVSKILPPSIFIHVYFKYIYVLIYMEITAQINQIYWKFWMFSSYFKYIQIYIQIYLQIYLQICWQFEMFSFLLLTTSAAPALPQFQRQPPVKRKTLKKYLKCFDMQDSVWKKYVEILWNAGFSLKHTLKCRESVFGWSRIFCCQLCLIRNSYYLLGNT